MLKIVSENFIHALLLLLGLFLKISRWVLLFMPTRLSKVLTTFDITMNFKKLYFVFVVGETLTM